MLQSLGLQRVRHDQVIELRTIDWEAWIQEVLEL